HDDFESVIIDIPELENADDIVGKIETLAREQNILRVKGYASVKGKPMRLLVQAVSARVRTQFDQPWGDQPRQGQMVVIAEHHDINVDAIKAVLCS
ncbi:MAG: GTP-binding protein, partial [Halocynthiibacter sp.]